MRADDLLIATVQSTKELTPEMMSTPTTLRVHLFDDVLARNISDRVEHARFFDIKLDSMSVDDFEDELHDELEEKMEYVEFVVRDCPHLRIGYSLHQGGLGVILATVATDGQYGWIATVPTALIDASRAHVARWIEQGRMDDVVKFEDGHTIRGTDFVLMMDH